ncbi:hypothetical protein RFI_32818, partial [Reticulomyxa filosa]
MMLQKQIEVLAKSLQQKVKLIDVEQKSQENIDNKYVPKIEESAPYAVPILSERPYVGQTIIVNDDLRLDKFDKNATTLALESSNRFRNIFDGSRDNFPRWRRQFLAWKNTYQLTDCFCFRYVLSQCLSAEVQEMMIYQNLYDFNDMMSWMCKTFGGKHYVGDRTAALLNFKTRFGEEPSDIMLRWRQAKFALKLELDYAIECNVPARKRLEPCDDRLMEALLDSLTGIVRRLVLDQNPTTFAETEAALDTSQDRFEEETKFRQMRYSRQGPKRLDKNTDESRGQRYLDKKYNRITVKNVDKKYKNPSKDNAFAKYHKTNNKKQWNDECWGCCEHGHKQRDCPNNTNELQVMEKQYVEHILPMLGIDRVMEEPDAMEIKLHTKESGTIHAMADTGASICAVNDNIANQFQHLWTKDTRAFVVAHAGGSIILQKKLDLTIDNKHAKSFKESFYI